MKESNHARPKTASAEGFQISEKPVVRAKRSASRNGAAEDPSQASARDVDLLYVIARDPRSLFVYWDVNWTRLFTRAALSPRQVHLRIYRREGEVEGTREINPFLDHCYLEVPDAGTAYYCELGCHEDDAWQALVRSGTTETPQDSLSGDISAQFATLPLHLSFQRILDAFDSAEAERPTLAEKVGKLQALARTAAANPGRDEGRLAELNALLEAALRGETTPPPTEEQLAQWQTLGEQFDDASWGGASESGRGGSSFG